MRVPLVQDKSPIHGDNIIKYWFEQNPKLGPLPWPAKGADLNPIENVWGEMVKDCVFSSSL